MSSRRAGAAVRRDVAPADREPEAAAGRPAVVGPQAEVRLEDAPPLGLGHAVAVVGDADANRLADKARGQAHAVLRLAVDRRVLDWFFDTFISLKSTRF